MIAAALNLSMCVVSTPLMLYWGTRWWNVQRLNDAKLEILLRSDEQRVRMLWGMLL